MKQKAKEWANTKGKVIAERWFIFLVMFLVILVGLIFAVPLVALLAAGCIVYTILAGFASILNEIFYHKPVDETFDELTNKLADWIYDLIIN